MEFSMRRKYNEGDLCVADGYGSRVWEIEGFTLELMYLKGKIEEEIIYNFKCIITNERIIAYQSDVLLVCRAAYVYDYIRQLDSNGRPPKSTVNIAGEEEENMNMHKYPNTEDGMLDELTDLLFITEVVGEADEHLQGRIDEVKARLTKKQEEE